MEDDACSVEEFETSIGETHQFSLYGTNLTVLNLQQAETTQKFAPRSSLTSVNPVMPYVTRMENNLNKTLQKIKPHEMYYSKHVTLLMQANIRRYHYTVTSILLAALGFHVMGRIVWCLPEYY